MEPSFEEFEEKFNLLDEDEKKILLQKMREFQQEDMKETHVEEPHMEKPKKPPVVVAGIPTKALVALTQSLMRRVSIQESYTASIATRKQAAEALALIADTAYNNPLLHIATLYGEVPKGLEISIPEEEMLEQLYSLE